MKNSKELNLVNENNYLVTKMVDLSSISTTQLSSDLEQLAKAEQHSIYKPNIAKGEKNPLIYRAMSALRLSNPFKGY